MIEAKLQNLFFALWPDDAVRTGLIRVQKRLSAPDGRMHHPQDLHMTLVFLGRVPSERLPCITEMAGTIESQEFVLELTKIDYWNRPRILWCGLEQTPDPLMQLVRDLQQGLTGCGFQPESRSYRPHVTLARKARPMKAQSLEEPVVWRPKEFVLAGSSSGSKPRRYRILDRWGI